MTRLAAAALAVALCGGACAVPLTLQAAPAKAMPGAYRPPMNSFGQPDFSGNWSNVSMTPESRPASAKSGARLTTSYP